ncbi:DUF6250 domain-containing protein [Sphingobacterium oryzagri]|uniref:DUF6250 domain-containing protein n=1 Tax=Sphingobacterium oryzagri TaxID=3025669 RepID=A0ABY7WB28_9SPHI|nr:DUF6250 domain-containing protein [Sphingobacterium sp. KACC 22765]WDF66862.1 DUF6250 domain-containing protein [Sphingobacterium sp. KACC 22765]
MVRQLVTSIGKIGFLVLLANEVCAQSLSKAHRFNLADSTAWRVEFEFPERSLIEREGDGILISSYGGATLWLDSLLQGDYVISYERIVLLDSGIYDRLSDLNQFWLASEPDRQAQLDQRDGKLSSYDSLRLFYVGMGGNNNSTTRFRRYDGAGNRVLLAEKNEKSYLLQPNVYYEIKTIVSHTRGFTAFYVNGKLLFMYKGSVPPVGFFGLRQTATRQKIRNFRLSPITD